MCLAAKVVGSLALAAALGSLALAQEKGETVTEPAKKPAVSLEEQAEKAFAAARKGDYEPLVALADRAKDLVPVLPRYAKDPSADVRREVVALLKAAGDPRAEPLLIEMLADADREVRQSAAAAVYREYDPRRIAGHAKAAKALAEHVADGETASAPSLLLLGYAPGPASEAALKKARKEHGDDQTKLLEWMAPVPVQLAADVALSRLGDQDARRELLQASSGKDLDQLLFLLTVLREIDSPEALRALAAALDDARLTGTGVISGAKGPRRLCDDAVDAFVRRLNLKVDFALVDGRAYAPTQIDQVRRKVREAMPSPGAPKPGDA